jgi:hypothetical protein
MQRPSRRVLAWLAVLALATGPACPSRTPASGDGAAAEADASDPAAGYEQPPLLRASEILPEALLRGPHHEVREEVESDGFWRLYTVDSEFGTFAVRGDTLLRERVREIEALAVLRETSATAEFAAAAARALGSPFVAAWNLVRHPVDSIVGVPLGAWRLLRRASELGRGERGELEEGALEAFIGFEARKRELAQRLDVDPYSSNPALQRELNRLSWVSFAGGLPALFVPFQGSPSSPPEPDAPGDRLLDLLLHHSPDDLRRLNRIELAVMGIDAGLADRFLAHPWYSPRHETVLVASLAALDLTSGRPAFIEAALEAGSEEDALGYQRTAELIRAYNDRAAPIASIVELGGTLAGTTADGRLVVPLVADEAAWTARADALCRRVARPPQDVRGTELVLSGTLTPRARAHVEALGIVVTERAFERLGQVEEAEGR